MWFKWGSFLMGLAVILGAFGAHGLKQKLTPEMMEIYKTAVLYHLIHALAILIVGLRLTQGAETKTQWAAFLFSAGIFIFSGSLYLLSMTGIRWLGAVTPIGGVCFIAAWLLLVWSS